MELMRIVVYIDNLIVEILEMEYSLTKKGYLNHNLCWCIDKIKKEYQDIEGLKIELKFLKENPTN